MIKIIENNNIMINLYNISIYKFLERLEDVKVKDALQHLHF